MTRLHRLYTIVWDIESFKIVQVHCAQNVARDCALEEGAYQPWFRLQFCLFFERSSRNVHNHSFTVLNPTS